MVMLYHHTLNAVLGLMIQFARNTRIGGAPIGESLSNPRSDRRVRAPASRQLDPVQLDESKIIF